MADTEFVRFCNNCYLVVKPDERIYRDATIRCPRCGFPYIKTDYESEDNV